MTLHIGLSRPLDHTVIQRQLTLAIGEPDAIGRHRRTASICEPLGSFRLGTQRRQPRTEVLLGLERDRPRGFGGIDRPEFGPFDALARDLVAQFEHTRPAVTFAAPCAR
jgi:hypothetical protein